VKRVPIKQKIKAIPPGELAVRRGTRVEATDGPIGRVEEFVVEPADGPITHLVLRKGHPWGQKQVTIPVSEVARIAENVVHLKLNKWQIGTLPQVPVLRKWA